MNHYIEGSTNFQKSLVEYHAKNSKSHTVAYELHIKEGGKDSKKLKNFKHSAAGSNDVLEGISTMEKIKWLGLKLNLKQHILLQSKNCHL